MPDNQTAEARALAERSARAWLHSYGINTQAYTCGGGDHPAMRTLPDAFLAFAKSLAEAASYTTDAFAALREITPSGVRAFQIGEPIRESASSALAEIDNLRALVMRLTNVAEDLSRATRDPGTEALAAIYCGRHFIYG